KTNGRFVSDIKADEFGVYAANTDTHLYCLDRKDGKLKWVYYGGTQLRDSPVVTATLVYQYVPRTGVAAIDKTAGEPIRKPRWIAKNALQFLSEDQKLVYLRRRDGRIDAVDKMTGKVQFTSKTSFDVFAINLKDSTIFAAMRDGR